MPVERPTEINISLPSQIAPGPGLLLRSASFYVDKALEAGYDGHEWFPMRNLAEVGRQTNDGALPDYVKESIRSAHQSWRHEKTFGEAWDNPNRKLRWLGMASYFLFPETTESLEYINRLQEQLGRKLPVVMYPDTEGGRHTDFEFKNKTYQPSANVTREFGANTIQEMIDEGRRRGFDSLTVDIHHMLGLGRWEEVLPRLLPHATEIHIALGRIDDELDPKTQQKLEDLYSGRKGTEIYRILETIKRIWSGGIVVTEIPYQALATLRKKYKESLETKDLVEDHRRIVDNLREALL